jgi:peptide/nickel transport system permease protein
MENPSAIQDFMGDPRYRIYFLMAFLTLFSWPGTARLVRGQILFLREQEYMVAAEAMGYSTSRKIFKHLVPNVMPQLIVQMSLSLGGMILYEATLSYLNLGVPAPYAAWGTMINIISTDMDILKNYFNVWGPAGICIVIAVLGFNFVGDGLRDALDPKMRR